MQQLQEKVHVDYIIDQQNLDVEEYDDENQEAGPLVGHMNTREKPVVPRTPTKQKELTLSLPQILDKVKVVGDMLGSINKLKYVDHDVEETRNLCEFVQQVYMESRGEGPSRDPILELKQDYKTL
jgi:hypothetical protein